MTIVTYYDPPPIPLRDYDWRAWDDDTYDYDQPMGMGLTEAGAVADLLEKLADEED
jgi:hypothetical protein